MRCPQNGGVYCGWLRFGRKNIGRNRANVPWILTSIDLFGFRNSAYVILLPAKAHLVVYQVGS